MVFVVLAAFGGKAKKQFAFGKRVVSCRGTPGRQASNKNTWPNKQLRDPFETRDLHTTPASAGVRPGVDFSLVFKG